MGANRIESVEVGKRISERLEELGWSQRRLALEAQRFAGCEVVGESQVSRICAGDRFVPLTIKMLAETMGLSYLWLVEGIGERLILRTESEHLKIAEENDPRLRQIRRSCAAMDDSGRDIVLALVRSLGEGRPGSKRGVNG
jgi:transcriptional regulator with XRE-family HTH domain